VNMTLKEAIATGFAILRNPEKEFKTLRKRTLEEVVEDYIKLLLLAGLATGIVLFIFNIAKAGFFDILRGVTVDYGRLANYSMSFFAGAFFLYLFAGTFLLFLLSMLIRIFVRKIKFTELIKIMCYSMTPVLFFGWVPISIVPALFVWAVFIFAVGIKK